MTLLGRCKRSSQFGNRAQGRVVFLAGGRMRMNEKNCIAKAAAFGQRCDDPAPQGFGIFDFTRLDRPFDAA